MLNSANMALNRSADIIRFYFSAFRAAPGQLYVRLHKSLNIPNRPQS